MKVTDALSRPSECSMSSSDVTDLVLDAAKKKQDDTGSVDCDSARETDDEKEELSYLAGSVFESFGLLEHILSFLNASSELLSATCVSKRWKRAGRADALWKAAISHLWESKSGVSPELPIFWRSLFTKDAVKRLSVEQIRQIFEHPLLSEKRQLLESEKGAAPAHMKDNAFISGGITRRKSVDDIGSTTDSSDCDEACDAKKPGAIIRGSKSTDDTAATEISKKNTRGILDKGELGRFLQVHMLDVMSDNGDDGPGLHHFFSDIYFGSYACSIRDAERTVITSLELCTPYGFDMYFKIAAREVDEDDRSFLVPYEPDPPGPDSENILLYHHSTCYFAENRDFSIVLKQHIQSTYPTDLKWRWLDVGRRVQVGPYPHLVVIRQKDWGWKLENGHVVLLFRDKP